MLVKDTQELINYGYIYKKIPISKSELIDRIYFNYKIMTNKQREQFVITSDNPIYKDLMKEIEVSK